MKNFFYLFILILFSASSFLGGIIWHKHQLLNGHAVELTETIPLTTMAGATGLLPKGTVLYPYNSFFFGEDIPRYIVFITTKQLGLLQPIQFEHPFTVAPIEAYK